MAQFFGLPGADRVKARTDVLAAATFKNKVEGELKLHRFEVVKMLGKGAYGVCHLVLDTTTGEEYVVKSVDLSNMREKERKVALAEAQILAKLNNPNIVAYYGAWIEETVLPGMAWAGPVKCLHILLEYCDGGELAGAIKKRKLAHGHFSENRVLVWFTQLTSALTYLHAQRILHRDLKTQNVFLKGKGRNTVIKLGDFGVAKTFFAEKSLASTAVGTPIYMAPELFTGEAYSYRSDIWSMGCILYEMCALKHAFTDPNGSLPGLISAITSGRYDPVPSHYSDELRALVTCMLKRDTKERPSCAQLVSMPILQKGLAISLHVEQEKGARAVRAAHKVLRTHSQRVLVSAGLPTGAGGLVHSGFPRPAVPLEGVSEEHDYAARASALSAADTSLLDASDEDEEYGWKTEDEEALMEQEEEEGEEGEEEEGAEDEEEEEEEEYEGGEEAEQVWSEGDLSFEQQADFYGGYGAPGSTNTDNPNTHGGGDDTTYDPGNESSVGSVPSFTGSTDPAAVSLSQAPSLLLSEGGVSITAGTSTSSIASSGPPSANLSAHQHPVTHTGEQKRTEPAASAPTAAAAATALLSPASSAKPGVQTPSAVLAPAVPASVARAQAGTSVTSPAPAVGGKMSSAPASTPSSSSAATKPSPQARGGSSSTSTTTRQPGVVYAGTSAAAQGLGPAGLGASSFGIVGQKAPVVKQQLTSPVPASSPVPAQRTIGRGTGTGGVPALPLSPAPTALASLASPTGVNTPATAAAARTAAAAAPPVAPPKAALSSVRSPALLHAAQGAAAGAGTGTASPRRTPAVAGATGQATPAKGAVPTGSARKATSVLSPTAPSSVAGTRPTSSGTGAGTGVKKLARSTVTGAAKSTSAAAAGGTGAKPKSSVKRSGTGVATGTGSGKIGASTKGGAKKGTGKGTGGSKGSAKKAGEKGTSAPAAGSAGAAAAMDDLMAQVVDLRAAIQEVEVQEAQDEHDKQGADTAYGGDLCSPAQQSPRAGAFSMAIGIDSPEGGAAATAGSASGGAQRPTSAFGGVRPASAAGMRPGSAAAGKRSSLGRAQLQLEAAAVHLEIAKGLQNLAAIAEQAEAAEVAGAPLLHMVDSISGVGGSGASDVNSSLDSSLASLSSAEEPGIVFSSMYEGVEASSASSMLEGAGAVGSFATPRPVEAEGGQQDGEAVGGAVAAVGEGGSETIHIVSTTDGTRSTVDAPVDARQHHTATTIPSGEHTHAHGHGHGPLVAPPQPPAPPPGPVRGRSIGLALPPALPPPPPLPPVGLHAAAAAMSNSSVETAPGGLEPDGSATPTTVAAGGVGSAEAGGLLMALHDGPVQEDTTSLASSHTVSTAPTPWEQIQEQVTRQVGGAESLAALSSAVDACLTVSPHTGGTSNNMGEVSDTLVAALLNSSAVGEEMVTIPKHAVALLVQLGALHGLRSLGPPPPLG